MDSSLRGSAQSSRIILADRSLIQNERYQGTYRVHSVYRNVLNLTTDNDVLVSVVNTNISMGPARIRVPEDMDFRTAAESCIPVIHGQMITFPSVEGTLAFWNTQSFPASCIRNSPAAAAAKLYPVLERERRRIFDPDSKTTQMILEILEEKLRQGSLLDIIGFGPGLTPLGDDCVLGYLLGETVLEQRTHEELFPRIKNRTSLISAEFLYQICHGGISDDLMEMAREVLAEDAGTWKTEQVLNYGHSSGWGILFGFRMYLVNKEETCQNTPKY